MFTSTLWLTGVCVNRLELWFCLFQTGLFAAKPAGFGTQTSGLFGQQSGTGSTGFSFAQAQPQSTFGGSLFGAKTSTSTGFGGFGAAGTTGFSIIFA